MKNLNDLKKYNKFLVAIITGVVASLSYLYSDTSWLPVLVNTLGALGVYTVPNKR